MIGSTKTGLIYMGVSTSLFMIIGIFIGVKISGNNDLQFFDFVKVVITIWLTQLAVFMSMYVIMNRYEDDND